MGIEWMKPNIQFSICEYIVRFYSSDRTSFLIKIKKNLFSPFYQTSKNLILTKNLKKKKKLLYIYTHQQKKIGYNWKCENETKGK